jgi:hypothetical protein
MNLIFYDLAQYVVETSLGLPIGGADCVGAQSVWMEMCGLVVANTIRHKRRSWVVWLEPTPLVKP